MSVCRCCCSCKPKHPPLFECKRASAIATILKKFVAAHKKKHSSFGANCVIKMKEIASSSHTYHDSCLPKESGNGLLCAKHRHRLNFALFFINFDAPLRGQYACYVCLMFKLQKIKYKNLPLFDRDERKKSLKCSVCYRYVSVAINQEDKLCSNKCA